MLYEDEKTLHASYKSWLTSLTRSSKKNQVDSFISTVIISFLWSVSIEVRNMSTLNNLVLFDFGIIPTVSKNIAHSYPMLGAKGSHMETRLTLDRGGVSG